MSDDFTNVSPCTDQPDISGTTIVDDSSDIEKAHIKDDFKEVTEAPKP